MWDVTLKDDKSEHCPSGHQKYNRPWQDVAGWGKERRGSWVNETGARPWWAGTKRGIVGSCEHMCVQRSQEGPTAGCWNVKPTQRGPLFWQGTQCVKHTANTGLYTDTHTPHRLKASVKGCGQNWVTYVYFQVLLCTIPGVNRRCIKYCFWSVFAG